MRNPKIVDMTGKKIGKWLVLAQYGNSARGAAIWKCRCECGEIGHPSGADLRNGKSTNCGCSRATAMKHGDSPKKGKKARLYTTWLNMRRRCSVPSSTGYKNYGGRGISVCPEWNDYPVFKAWAHSNGYSASLTLERIDCDQGYAPGNCTWATRLRQARNRRFVKKSPDGTPWCEVANINGITTVQFNGRIFDGWSIEDAATRPIAARFANLKK